MGLARLSYNYICHNQTCAVKGFGDEFCQYLRVAFGGTCGGCISSFMGNLEGFGCTPCCVPRHRMDTLIFRQLMRC